MKMVHRDELVILLQNANCLKNCSVVGKLSKPMSLLLGERPSVETLAPTLNSTDEKEFVGGRKLLRKPKIRYVACIDPEMPWIRIQEGESACIAKTTSVETVSNWEDPQCDDTSRMKQEMDELKELLQQLVLSKSAP